MLVLIKYSLDFHSSIAFIHFINLTIRFVRTVGAIEETITAVKVPNTGRVVHTPETSSRLVAVLGASFLRFIIARSTIEVSITSDHAIHTSA